jgi:hypothetical protein
MRCFATLSSFWHKWSDYAAICANMRAEADQMTGRLVERVYFLLSPFTPDSGQSATSPGTSG